jgi:hypothetical protein
MDERLAFGPRIESQKKMNSPPTFFGTAGEPVLAVDAEDPQTAYEILTDPAHRPPSGGRGGFSIDFLIRLAKPGPTFRRLLIAP